LLLLLLETEVELGMVREGDDDKKMVFGMLRG
jgi:hypothetical protein